MRAPMKLPTLCCLVVAFVLVWSTARAMGAPAPLDKRLRARVTVILDKLPTDKRAKMANFAEKVQNYINTRAWIEEDYVRPFEIGLQMFLEDSPSAVEDRYRCSLVVSGPDIQFTDKRAIFPFQENEQIHETATYMPVRGLIDFYIYLLIANEVDKYGAFAGEEYYAKARSMMQEGKFSQYALGWDWRDDLMRTLASENYKKFREMKDYFFYGLWSTEGEREQTRQYVLEALHRLEEVLKENKDNIGAKFFIDAHYQEVIEIFRDSGDATPFKILTRLDPDRKDIYKEFIGTH